MSTAMTIGTNSAAALASTKTQSIPPLNTSQRRSCSRAASGFTVAAQRSSKLRPKDDGVPLQHAPHAAAASPAPPDNEARMSAPGTKYEFFSGRHPAQL